MNRNKEEIYFLILVRLLKHIGYGRMQQIISHEWYRHDAAGAALANTCYGLLPIDERRAYAQLAESDPLFHEVLE